MLVVACAVALGLQGVAAVEQSWTMDEPYHLLAGYQALRFGLDTVNLEHPPLVKLVAAVPLLLEDPPPWDAPVSADRALAATQRLFDDPVLAERVRVRVRCLLLAAFALPFLAACFCLGRVLGGADAGLLLAAALGLSPGVLPFLSLAQTDAAVALGFVTCLLGGVLLIRRPRVRWALLVGLGLGVGLASKFSAVLLIPVAAFAVLAIPARSLGGATLRRRLGYAAAVAAVAVAIPYGVYAFADRDDPGPPLRESIRLYSTNRSTLLIDERLEPWQDDLLAVQGVSSAAARWGLGFLGIRAQNQIGVYPSYAFGSVDSDGRWWYFPAAFLVRTPLVLLVALALALAGFLRGPRTLVLATRAANREHLLLIASLALFLGVALGSSYNIGSRHLLPVIPVLYLPAVLWAVRSDVRPTVLGTLLLVEACALTPAWMSATNTWWLGPVNPTRHALGGSDGDYEQGLHTLGRVCTRRGMATVRVVHPTASKGEVLAAFPGAIRVEPEDPLEPGWYAVSIMIEQLVPAILDAKPEDLYDAPAYTHLARRWNRVWLEIRDRGQEAGYVAGTFHLYYVPADE